MRGKRLKRKRGKSKRWMGHLDVPLITQLIYLETNWQPNSDKNDPFYKDPSCINCWCRIFRHLRLLTKRNE